MLSGGAFTGCFNYLQLAKGLACSLPLFVCSLQGICAERERAAAFRTEKKGTRSLGPIPRASLNLLLQDALPPEASSGREGKLYLWLAQLPTPWAPLLEFAGVLCWFRLYVFLGDICLCMHVGRDARVECRAFRVLSKTPSCGVPPSTPPIFIFKH